MIPGRITGLNIIGIRRLLLILGYAGSSDFIEIFEIFGGFVLLLGLLLEVRRFALLLFLLLDWREWELVERRPGLADLVPRPTRYLKVLSQTVKHRCQAVKVLLLAQKTRGVLKEEVEEAEAVTWHQGPSSSGNRMTY